jgi:hypothetical protein
MTRQFLIQFDNKPHELANLTRALAARGIHVHHLSCVGAGPLACAFVTATEDSDAMRDVLHGLGHSYIEGEPILVEVADTPGALAEVTGKLAGAGIEVCGVLAVGRRPGLQEFAFCVSDVAKARDVLGLTALASVGVSD